MTKIELQQENARLHSENMGLRKRLSEIEVELKIAKQPPPRLPAHLQLRGGKPTPNLTSKAQL